MSGDFGKIWKYKFWKWRTSNFSPQQKIKPEHPCRMSVVSSVSQRKLERTTFLAYNGNLVKAINATLQEQKNKETRKRIHTTNAGQHIKTWKANRVLNGTPPKHNKTANNIPQSLQRKGRVLSCVPGTAYRTDEGLPTLIGPDSEECMSSLRPLEGRCWSPFQLQNIKAELQSAWSQDVVRDGQHCFA